MIDDLSGAIGQFFGDIELETCTDASVSRPRVMPIMVFPPKTRVEFPRRLREMFPIGTRFKATVKVCQKTIDRNPHESPYLKAYDIAVVPESVPDEGLLARVREGSVSGLAYEYHCVTKR